MNILDLRNVQADVSRAVTLLDEARTLLIQGNPAIPGLLEGDMVFQRDEAGKAISQAIRFAGHITSELRKREKAYRGIADKIDV